MKTFSGLILIIVSMINAAFTANLTISISGLSYSPSHVEVIFGDTLTISASSTFPLVQVDKDIWYENDATPLPGGWGIKTSDYTFTIISDEPIYFVCQNYVSAGMKGDIVVQSILSVSNKFIIADNFSLYPNPFPDYTHVCYLSSEKCDVIILDIAGNKILTIFSETNADGKYCFDFKPKEYMFCPGIYFIQIKTYRNKYLAKAIYLK